VLDQVVEGERALPEGPERQIRPGCGDWWEHGVQAGAVGQPCVGIRPAVVESPPAARGQALGQPAYVIGVADVDGRALQSPAAVHPHLHAVDQHICDGRVGQ
jgi:hypothetical protein